MDLFPTWPSIKKSKDVSIARVKTDALNDTTIQNFWFDQFVSNDSIQFHV